MSCLECLHSGALKTWQPDRFLSLLGPFKWDKCLRTWVVISWARKGGHRGWKLRNKWLKYSSSSSDLIIINFLKIPYNRCRSSQNVMVGSLVEVFLQHGFPAPSPTEVLTQCFWDGTQACQILPNTLDGSVSDHKLRKEPLTDKVLSVGF